jgi:nitrous oxidase accessory protein NosD
MDRRRIGRLAGLCVVMACLGGASPSLAGTYTQVDCGSGADLQAAIDAAPKGGILDISGTCVGSFTVGKNVVLRGVSNAVLDAQGRDTTLTVTMGHVRLSRLTVTGAGHDNGGGVGGIQNAGILTLVRATVADNNGDAVGIGNLGTLIVQRSLVTLNGDMGDVGGIWNRGVATIEKSTINDNGGTGVVSSNSLTLIDSTVSGNISYPNAGGIDTGGTTTIIRSTIANNVSANSEGGGILNRGSLTVTESTVVGNEGDDATGGLANYGTATVGATIIAGNVVGQYAWDCSGSIESNGFNLIGTTFLVAFGRTDQVCDFHARSTDQVGGPTPIDPHLTPLGNHGGATQTALPRPTSPAVDAIPVGALAADGVTPLCPASGTTDQRGVARPRGADCDIGSVER